MEKYSYTTEELSFLEHGEIPCAVFQLLEDRLVTIVLSRGFFDLFGYSGRDRQEIYDMMDRNRYHDVYSDDIAALRDASYRFKNNVEEKYDMIFRFLVHGEYRIMHAYGSHVFKPGDVHLVFVWFTDQGSYSGTKHDTTLLGLLDKELTARSINVRTRLDYLTGLSSMSYFLELADSGCQKIRNEKNIPAILYFDFNGMKRFNQKYGMSGGDDYLKNFAKLLADEFTHEQSSRFSSDHFCAYSDLNDALQKAEKILAYNDALDPKMSLRIGIYKYDDAKTSISEACDRAKIACDSRKNTFKSEICLFERALQKDLERKQYIVENFEKALQEGWITVYFQAIVRTINRQVCNEEALTRWADPVLGFLNPNDYISVLEESGLIYKHDLYVLDRVLKKMKLQAENGLFVVPSSINLSKSDFYSCNMVEEIIRRVDAAGISRDHIVIEITESAIANDFNYMAKKIRELQDAGFPVWMDDYGSGYSSPALLQNIAFDLIKIDRSFVEQILHNEKARIIITEIVRLAMSLGIDTIAEGVENKDQIEFLNDIGCTMLQGFYFTVPVSMEQILERKKSGTLIGFEDPAESDYYAKLGKVNLYNLSNPHLDNHRLKNYFDTWPMVMVECKDCSLSVVKYNESFKTFVDENFSTSFVTEINNIKNYSGKAGYYSLNAVMQCARDGQKVILDDRTRGGTTIQLLIWRVAVNPVNGVAAVMVVILSAVESPSDKTSLTYNYIARALAEDYVFLYFVNMDTGDFTEYSSNSANREVTVERRGKNFFEESYAVAPKQIHKDDLETFLNSFTKENIEKGIRENGTFSLIYRNYIHGEPVYVIMKIVKIRDGKNNIIIGINNIDEQMKQKESLKRIQEERMVFSRIAALSGDVLAIYTVDPVTDEFFEFCSNELYDSIEIIVQGKDFYRESLSESTRVIHPDDLIYFNAHFTKEKILQDIQENGMFIMNYRILIQGQPIHVLLKATMIHENDENKLIVGVINVEKEVRKNKEYEKTLSTIKMEAIRDDLTGVKRKNAYYSLEEQLNDQIKNNPDLHFAVVVCDINGLKFINDTLGHQAGDQYIIDGCKMICTTFKRSPVFRLGGDEFAVVVQDEDYEHLDQHIAEMNQLNLEHQSSGKVVVATGVSRFDNDKSVSEVFKRADEYMYENKRKLKALLPACL